MLAIYSLLVFVVVFIAVLSYIVFDFWVATVITIALVVMLVGVLALLYLIARRELRELYGLLFLNPTIIGG